MKKILLLTVVLSLAAGASARSLRCPYRATVEGVRLACPVVVGDVPRWARSATVRIEGREAPSQLDLALGEVAFVTDIDGTLDFEVVYRSRCVGERYPARVHAQMWLKRADKTLTAVDTASSVRDDMYRKLHHHGPAFESERAAYRIYFDKKQTVDTYGKKQPGLELARTMWYPDEAQLAAGFGHDNLRVFGTVGVGTLKGWDAGKGKAVHIKEFRRREARIVARGPVRTIVEMRVEGWRCGGREIDLTSRYILYAGHSDVRVENRIEGDTAGLVFTTGVMKMARRRIERRADAVAVYGCDFPENDTLRWERERVGLAVVVPAAQIVSRIDDGVNHLFQLRPDHRGRIDYVFDMWWRKSAWLQAVDDEAFLPAMLEALEKEAVHARVERLRKF